MCHTHQAKRKAEKDAAWQKEKAERNAKAKEARAARKAAAEAAEAEAERSDIMLALCARGFVCVHLCICVSPPVHFLDMWAHAAP